MTNVQTLEYMLTSLSSGIQLIPGLAQVFHAWPEAA